MFDWCHQWPPPVCVEHPMANTARKPAKKTPQPPELTKWLEKIALSETHSTQPEEYDQIGSVAERLPARIEMDELKVSAAMSASRNQFFIKLSASVVPETAHRACAWWRRYTNPTELLIRNRPVCCGLLVRMWKFSARNHYANHNAGSLWRDRKSVEPLHSQIRRQFVSAQEKQSRQQNFVRKSLGPEHETIRQHPSEHSGAWRRSDSNGDAYACLDRTPKWRRQG